MTENKTFLLLLEHQENRRLLAESLTESYRVLSPEADGRLTQFNSLLQQSFDLCIVDGRTKRESRSTVTRM